MLPAERDPVDVIEFEGSWYVAIEDGPVFRADSLEGSWQEVPELEADFFGVADGSLFAVKRRPQTSGTHSMRYTFESTTWTGTTFPRSYTLDWFEGTWIAGYFSHTTSYSMSQDFQSWKTIPGLEDGSDDLPPQIFVRDDFLILRGTNGNYASDPDVEGMSLVFSSDAENWAFVYPEISEPGEYDPYSIREAVSTEDELLLYVATPYTTQSTYLVRINKEWLKRQLSFGLVTLSDSTAHARGFGAITEREGWTHSSYHGWIYRTENDWQFDNELGWIFYRPVDMGPVIWQANTSHWLYYLEDTNPRWFWNYSTEEWVSYPKSFSE